MSSLFVTGLQDIGGLVLGVKSIVDTKTKLITHHRIAQETTFFESPLLLRAARSELCSCPVLVPSSDMPPRLKTSGVVRRSDMPPSRENPWRCPPLVSFSDNPLGSKASVPRELLCSTWYGVVAMTITLAPVVSVDIDVLRQDGPQLLDQGGSHELVPPATWGTGRTPGLLR